VLGNLWISDEAYFCLSGVVNKQNMRFWGLENPHVTHEQPLHDEKLLVWCAMSEHGIIGPFVFDGTVNSQRYREMLNNFFFPRLRALRIPLATTWFQQDGATALFKQKFGSCAIEIWCPPNLAPYSASMATQKSRFKRLRLLPLALGLLEIERVREWTKQLARLATKHRA